MNLNFNALAEGKLFLIIICDLRDNIVLHLERIREYEKNLLSCIVNGARRLAPSC